MEQCVSLWAAGQSHPQPFPMQQSTVGHAGGGKPVAQGLSASAPEWPQKIFPALSSQYGLAPVVGSFYGNLNDY